MKGWCEREKMGWMSECRAKALNHWDVLLGAHCNN